jgi:AcrR family transcriptional regulator
VRAAVTLADQIGMESLTMRRLAQELDVVPMALYKHVPNKEQLLDGMVDVIVAEIHLRDPTPTGGAPSVSRSCRRARRSFAMRGRSP